MSKANTIAPRDTAAARNFGTILKELDWRRYVIYIGFVVVFLFFAVLLRDQGFMAGFGIDTKDVNKIGDEDDPRIVGHDVTNGNEEGGRKAMENLLQKDNTINVIHTINEPAAVGAYQALKAVGKEGDVLIVSVDGGCPGVEAVVDGQIGATSQQYPLLMASLGIEAIAAFAKDGTKPKPTEGKEFFDTGVNLVTDKPANGVPSIDTKEGTDKCWG